MSKHMEALACPMGKNDAGAKTVGEYLKKLLLTLWNEQEGFSGKRPFGNSSWETEIYVALVNGGFVKGEVLGDRYLIGLDAPTKAWKFVEDMIKEVFK